jgi:hypothetical protein
MRKLHAAGFVATIVVLAGACGSDNNDDIITDDQGAAIGQAIAAQLATVPASFTVTDFASTAGGGGLFFARAGVKARPFGVSPALLNAACPNVTGDLSDDDQDDVPANALLTFQSPDCDGTNDDGFDYTVTGTLRIQDLPTAAVGYSATFTDLETTVTTGTGTIALQFNGTHGVSGTAAGGTLQEAVSLHLDVQGQGGNVSGTISNSWSVTFTAPGNDLAMGLPLPDGTFDIDGTFHYNVSGTNVRFDVSTQSSLDFDPTCGLDFPFSGGEVRAHLEGEDGNVYARIVYTGCGETPEVTFFGRNS